MEWKCPKCNGEIELDDIIDQEPAMTEFYQHCVGHCGKCGIDYQWTDVYVFDFKETRGLTEC